MQNFTRCTDANVNKFLMGWKFKYNLLCLLNLYNRYWNQVHTKHENLINIQYIKTETSQIINAAN